MEEETILEAQISNNETDENTPVDENIIDEKANKEKTVFSSLIECHFLFLFYSI